jgi:hypothetical protein
VAELRGGGSRLRELWYGSDIERQSAAAGEAHQRFNTAREAYRELVQGRRFEGGPEAKARSQSQIQAAHGLLLSLQNATQPGYFGVEDVYKKIQLEALSRNPLEEEIRNIQKDQLQQLIEMNEILKQKQQEGAIAVLR